MKNIREFDHNKMNINDLLLNKGKCDFITSDINGNENKTFINSCASDNDQSAKTESGSSHIHGPEKLLSESKQMRQNTFINSNIEDSRKLPPLRIPKARILFQSKGEDDDKTLCLRPQLKIRKSLKDKVSMNREEDSRNIFSDFSTSSETSDCVRAVASARISANKNEEITNKKPLKSPGILVTPDLENVTLERGFLSLPKTDNIDSQMQNSDRVHLYSKPISISVPQVDTNDDESESKSEFKEAKFTYGHDIFGNNTKEESHWSYDQVPQLSPVAIHSDSMYMLPSPKYPSHPPTLIPICESLTARTEEHQNFVFQIKNYLKPVPEKQSISLQTQNFQAPDVNCTRLSPPSISVIHPDATTVRVSSDSTTRLSPPDATNVRVSSDSTTRLSSSDGTTVRVSSDSTTRLSSPDAATRVSPPDVTTRLSSPDGATVRVSPPDVTNRFSSVDAASGRVASDFITRLSPSDATAVRVLPPDATTRCSPPDTTTVRVSSCDITINVSPPDATTKVSSPDITSSLPSYDTTTVRVLSHDVTTKVSTSDVITTLSSLDAAMRLSSPDTTSITVAPPNATAVTVSPSDVTTRFSPPVHYGWKEDHFHSVMRREMPALNQPCYKDQFEGVKKSSPITDTNSSLLMINLPIIPGGIIEKPSFCLEQSKLMPNASSVSDSQFSFKHISQTQASQTTTETKDITVCPHEKGANHLEKTGNQPSQEGLSEIAPLPVSSSECNVNCNDVSWIQSTSGQPIHERSNMPETRSMSKSPNKLDPDAVKNLSQQIIQLTAEKNMGSLKQTSQRSDQLYSVEANSRQLKPMAAKIGFNSIKRAEIIHKVKETGLSATNSYREMAENSQVHMHTGEFREARIGLTPKPSARHNHSTVYSQPNVADHRLQITKQANLQNTYLEQPFLDPLWANMLYKSHYPRENNTMMPNIILPSPLKNPIVSKSNSNNNSVNCQIIPHSQHILSLGKQRSRTRLNSCPVLHRSSENWNASRHLQASHVMHQNKLQQNAGEPKERHEYPLRVQVPDEITGSTRRASTELAMPSLQPLTLRDSQLLYPVKYQNLQHQGASKSVIMKTKRSTCQKLEMSQQTGTNQSHITPAFSAHVNGLLSGSQSLQLEKNNGLSTESMGQAIECSVNLNLPDEPLDLSQCTGKWQTPPCTDRMSSHFNPEPNKSVVQMVLHNTDSSMHQSELPVTAQTKQSPDLASHVPLNGDSCHLLSDVQTFRSNQTLPVLSSNSLTLPRTALTNSLPATICSTRSPFIHHKSPLLKTALLHNIIPEDRDPHPFNRVNPMSLVTQASLPDKLDDSRPSSNNTAVVEALKKQLPPTASLEPLSTVSIASSKVPLLGNQTSTVKSATAISTSAIQFSKASSSIMPDPGITKDVCSGNEPTALYTTAVVSPQMHCTSNFAIHGERRDLQNCNIYSVPSTSGCKLDDFTDYTEAVTSKVVPLPVKDFFTRTPKENTYSALLMAKITSQNNKQYNHREGTEPLPGAEPQNTNDRCDFEVNNHLHGRLVIDLTENDDDCELSPVCPQEDLQRDPGIEYLEVDFRDKDAILKSVIDYSRSGEITKPDAKQMKNLPQADLASGLKYARNFRELPQDRTSTLLFEDSLFTKSTNTDMSDLPSTNTVGIKEMVVTLNKEKYQVERNQENIKVGREVPFSGSISDTEDTVHTNITAVRPISQAHTLPNLAHQSDHYNFTMNETLEKSLKTINSSPALSLKIVPAGKEIMARKLMSAVAMRTPSEEITQKELASHLTKKHKEGTYLSMGVETQQSQVHKSEKVTQLSTSTSMHDNSTQSAAAILLQLSTNPMYNPFMISPENSGDYQEKVYQIHPMLRDHGNGKEGSTNNCKTSSPDFKSIQSHEVSKTTANKPGPRTGRRVGRPPKDQYSTSDGVKSPESKSVSTNSVISNVNAHNTITTIPSPLAQVSVSNTSIVNNISAQYSFPNFPLHPPDVFYMPQVTSVSTVSASFPSSGHSTEPVLHTLHGTYVFPTNDQLVRHVPRETVTTVENESLRCMNVSHSPVLSLGKQQSKRADEIEARTNEDSVHANSGKATNVQSSRPGSSQSISTTTTKISASAVFSFATFSAGTDNAERHSTNGIVLAPKSNGTADCSKSQILNNKTLDVLTKSPVHSMGSQIMAINLQTSNDPVDYTRRPAVSRDSELLNTIVPPHVYSDVSGIDSAALVDSNICLTNDSTINVVSSNHKLTTPRRRRGQKRKCQQGNSLQEKLLSIHAPYNEEFADTVSITDFPVTARPLHVVTSDTEINTEDLHNTKLGNNTARYDKTNINVKKRRSPQVNIKMKKRRKKSSTGLSNNNDRLEDLNSNEKIINLVDKTTAEDDLGVPLFKSGTFVTSEEQKSQNGDQTMPVNLQGSKNTPNSNVNTQKAYLHNEKITFIAEVQPFHNRTLPTLASADSALSENISAKTDDGGLDIEASESEKEREVTSLLAVMMCSKLKGHVQ